MVISAPLSSKGERPQIISTKFLDDEPVTKGLLDAMNASNGNQLGDLEKAVGVVIECCET